MAEYCDVAKQKRFREQESACIYVPPPLRSRKSVENKGTDISPQLSSVKNKITREFQGRDSTNNQSSKKCENSYMLFNLDKKSPPASNKKSPKISQNAQNRQSNDESLDSFKNSNTKMVKPKAKKCDNSYLLFSKESDSEGLDYLDNSNNKRTNYKSSKKQVPNSPKEQDSVQLVKTPPSVDGRISKISSNQIDINSTNSESCKYENMSMCDDLSLRMGTFSVSNRHLTKENNKFDEQFPKPLSSSSKKKCDNSSLLFDECPSNNDILSTQANDIPAVTRSNTPFFTSLGDSFNQINTKPIDVISDEKLAEKNTRKRPFLNDSPQETDDYSGGTVSSNVEDIVSKTLPKTPDSSSNVCGSETFDSIEDYVIEIYDFPVTFKTQDLMAIFTIYTQDGFYIKWVDDTHALGVFSNPSVVADVLKSSHTLVKVRALQNAISMSQEIASSIPIPCASRPKTCPSLARRLVSGALGLRVAVSDQVKQAEKKILQDAKAERRLAAKQREEAWEGTLRSNIGSNPS